MTFLAEPTDATAIIDRLRETYWACQTYRDSGELTLTYGLPGQQRSVRWSFATAFRQPRLRFAFDQGPGILVAPSDSQIGGCIWNSADTLWPELPRRDGLAIRQYLSIDTLGTVPALLSGDTVGPGWWISCSAFQLVGQEILDGTPCLVVTASARPPVTKVMLWIDETQYLLRRKAVDFTIGADGSLGRQVTDYAPVLDGPIDESLFKGGS